MGPIEQDGTICSLAAATVAGVRSIVGFSISLSTWQIFAQAFSTLIGEGFEVMPSLNRLVFGIFLWSWASPRWVVVMGLHQLKYCTVL